jgi:predicted NAD/FAD-dependent oxidoreductase
MWTLSRCIPQYVPEGKDMVCIHASSWRSAELLDREPARIAAALRADAEEIFGRLADPDWVRMYPRTEATVIPAPGHYRRMEAFLRRRRERTLYAGDWLTGSTVEGAVRTGLRAAEQVLSEEK